MSSSEIKNVILVGGNGNFGKPVLSALLTDSSLNITVLSRSDSEATFPSNVRVIRADYSSHESLTEALRGQEAVISFIGAMGLGIQKLLIDAAVAAGVKLFLPSEFGSNSANEKFPEWVPFVKDKREIVNYLKEKESQGLAWTAVITGPFFDWCLQIGFLGFDLRTKTATIIDNGSAPISATNLRQAPRALISILKNPARVANKYIYISDFETSQQEILRALEKLGNEKWTVKNVTSEEFVKTGHARIQANDFTGIALLLQAGMFSKIGLADNSAEKQWNEELGLGDEDFEESVKAVLDGKLVGQ